MTLQKSEFVVIGGGVVGLSVALGMLRSGSSVTVLNGADSDFRASTGNFGLVWLQDKGPNFAPYARWTRAAVEAWPEFSRSLEASSHIDVALDQSGGYEFFTDQGEFEEYADRLRAQQIHLGNRFSYELVSGDDMRREHPEFGPDVVGAAFCPLDGHVNPLRLLRALRATFLAEGGNITPDAHVVQVSSQPNGGFELQLEQGGRIAADRVALCAGLGATSLVRELGFSTEVKPQAGQLLITEKLVDRLPVLSSTIRQVDEGGVQIGASANDVGYNDGETADVICALAQHAVSVFPQLADVRVIRSWGALRVMSPDGHPVYAKSRHCDGAYLITCHSGITLASLHGSTLADWINGTSNAPELEAFDETRFSISEAA